MIVIADGDMAKAQALADELGQEIWELREKTATRHDSIDEALDAAIEAHAGRGADAGPVVLADVADNAGGGAPSDNTAILERIVARGITGVVSGCYWDPVAVQFCVEAGVGASFDLRIGGKCGVASGAPVDLRVTVRAVEANHSQGGLSGGRADLGASAWVTGEFPDRAGSVDLVLTTKRCQVFQPDAFTGLGCTLEDKRIVVVKSTQHFYAGFAPIAQQVRYVSAPGAIAPEFAEIAFTKRTIPYWPRVRDPFATNQG